MVAQRSGLSSAWACHDDRTRDTFKGAVLRTVGERNDGTHSVNIL